MCSRLAILKVWNTSATKSSEQTWRGEQPVPLRASLSLLISWSLVTTPTRAPSPCLSFWEILLEQLGQAPWIWHFQPVSRATGIWLSPVCQWQRSLVSHPSLQRDVVPTHHCWCLGPSQTSSCPWSSSGRCWIWPQGALLSKKSPPPTTKVEWNTTYLIPLRKERDVFILFCLFLYELEVFSNPVCWLQ